MIKEKRTDYRASIYLTRRCDVQCWYCVVPNIDAIKRKELSATGWRQVVDRMAEMGVTLAVNTGGEPFLRQDLLLDTIPYQINRGIYPVLLTNGRLLYRSERARETLRQLVDAGLRALSVSIDKISDQFNDQEGSISKSATGKWALDFAASLGMSDLSFTAVLDDTNPDATLDLLEWNAGRYSVLVQLVTRSVAGTFSGAQAVSLSTDTERHLDDALNTILQNAKTWKVETGHEYLQGILKRKHLGWACWLPGHVVVAPTGAVQLCNDIYGAALYEGLNLAETPLRSEELRSDYEDRWKRDLVTHCPGCYMRCHVDYHIIRTGQITKQ